MRNTLLAAGFALACASTAFGADRMVVVEDFNATWCGPCQPVGIALNALQDDYASNVIVFQVHQQDAYAITWGNQRAAFYGISGYPTVWFDGVDVRVGTTGSSTQDYNAFVGMLNGRMADATDVWIDLVTVPLEVNRVRIDATVGIDAGGVGKTMRVHLVQVLDNTPAGSHYLNCLIQAMNYETVTLDPGASTVVSHNFVLTGASATRPQDVKFIALAQANNTSGPAEIHNGAWIGTPASGACCMPDYSCAQMEESECAAAGGEYAGDGAPCTAELCSAPGACCVNNECFVLSETNCIASAGTFLGDGTVCAPDPCAVATGACCVGELCLEATAAECASFSGTYGGDGVPCEASTCAPGCAADITGPTEGAADGNVDALDFLRLIGQWGSPCTGPCDADITGPTPGEADGNVDSLDFLMLVAQWGSPGNC